MDLGLKVLRVCVCGSSPSLNRGSGPFCGDFAFILSPWQEAQLRPERLNTEPWRAARARAAAGSGASGGELKPNGRGAKNCDSAAAGERKAALLSLPPPPASRSGPAPRMGAVLFSRLSGMSESSNEEKGREKKEKQDEGFWKGRKCI